MVDISPRQSAAPMTISEISAAGHFGHDDFAARVTASTPAVLLSSLCAITRPRYCSLCYAEYTP